MRYVFVISLVLLASCGQKGALYMPAPEQTQEQEISAP